MQDFSERVLEPAMSVLAANIATVGASVGMLSLLYFFNLFAQSAATFSGGVVSVLAALLPLPGLFAQDQADGSLDRQAMAAIVFSDKERRRALEAIVKAAIDLLDREGLPALSIPTDLAPTQVGTAIGQPGSGQLDTITCPVGGTTPQLLAVTKPYVNGSGSFGIDGTGQIVHNTDSLFVEFNVKNPETGELLQGRDARLATIDITDEAGHFITNALAAPHDFEFDKAFDPLLMFSKKRYAGNMYEENADDYVHKYMGIALKRRDNAPIVKTIFGGAMKMLLDKRDVEGAFQFIQDRCDELVAGKVNYPQLTITKSLRAEYADPSRIAHKALADRIAVRDPGNAPAAGDRIGYIYIQPKAGQLASNLQGDRIETPQFIREKLLKPDYQYYIEHQLMNPISQAFGLLLERTPGFHPDMLKGCPTAAENLDKYLAFREKVASELLFDRCLHTCRAAASVAGFNALFRGHATVSKRVTTAPSSSSSSSSSSNGKQEAAPKKAVYVQKTMSSFMADAFMMMEIKAKDKKIAAARKQEQEQNETCAVAASASLPAADTKNPTTGAKKPTWKKKTAT